MLALRVCRSHTQQEKNEFPQPPISLLVHTVHQKELSWLLAG